MPDLTANTVVQAVLHTVRDFATNQIVDAMLQNLEVKDTVPASGLSYRSSLVGAGSVVTYTASWTPGAPGMQLACPLSGHLAMTTGVSSSEKSSRKRRGGGCWGVCGTQMLSGTAAATQDETGKDPNTVPSRTRSLSHKVARSRCGLSPLANAAAAAAAESGSPPRSSENDLHRRRSGGSAAPAADGSRRGHPGEEGPDGRRGLESGRGGRCRGHLKPGEALAQAGGAEAREQAHRSCSPTMRPS